MKIQSAKLVYFSPTGTTKAILHGVDRGINPMTVERIDLTRPDARKGRLEVSEDELLVVGVPVYLGRVPNLLTDWLHAIEARNTPAVCIVVYGNRSYGDALLELRDLLAERGCKPVAAAAYIGEHSYSSAEIPIAEARPDAGDLDHAESFGRKIYDKLRTASSIDQISAISIPGSSPYRGDTKLWSVDFIAISAACTLCGNCAAVCPVAAIDPDNGYLINKEKCITCCACIKNCPQNARSIQAGPVMDAAVRLHQLYKLRKEPVIYL